MTSLVGLYVENNELSGEVPSTLATLEKLDGLLLGGNQLSSSGTYSRIRAYHYSLCRHPTICLLKYSIAITKKRQDWLFTTSTSTDPAPLPLHPLFAFLVVN